MHARLSIPPYLRHKWACCHNLHISIKSFSRILHRQLCWCSYEQIGSASGESRQLCRCVHHKICISSSFPHLMMQTMVLAPPSFAPFVELRCGTYHLLHSNYLLDRISSFARIARDGKHGSPCACRWDCIVPINDELSVATFIIHVKCRYYSH